MRITQIHLFNFRSVQDLTLDVSEDGMHLIYGPFGAGKSSFLTGVRFALFGDNGQAGTNLDLRRRGAEPNTDAGCEVTFTQGQDTFVARRWLRRSERKAGAVEKAHASLHINGQKVDGITPRTLTTQMEEVLGLSAKAFTSAAMIPQGEVSTLMTAPPSEVQALIERHTGLDGLTKARDIARKTAHEKEQKAAALPGDPERIGLLKDQMVDAKKEQDDKETAANSAKECSTAAASLATKADKELQSLYARERKAQDYRQQKAAAHARKESAQQHVQTLEQEAHDAGIDLGKDAAADQQELDQLDMQMEQVTQAGRELADKGKRCDEADQALSEAHQAVATAENQAAAVKAQANTLDEREAVLTKKNDDLVQQMQESRSQYSVAETNVARLNKSISTLSGDDGNGHQCPTCQQEVADHDQLIADLIAMRDDTQATCDAALTLARQQRTDFNKVQGELSDIDVKRDQFQSALDKVENAKRDYTRAQETSAQLRQQAQDAATALRDVIASYGKTPSNDILADGRTIYSELKDSRDRLVSAVQVRKRHSDAIAAVAKVEAALVALEEAPVDAPAQEDITKAADKATELRSTADEAQAVLNEAIATHAAAKSAYGLLEYQLEEAQYEWDYKVKQTAEATIARGEADVLSALRSDLLTEYTASICRSASDMLAGFGGEYVAFHLDDDFVPRAELADGTLVNTSILSGGESALVGLAFRCGLTLHVTGGGLPEQIIGDEVTNYLDEDGRRAVLSLLNRLFPSVILVSHTEESRDYASAVHGVVRAELGTTEWANPDADTLPESDTDSAHAA